MFDQIAESLKQKFPNVNIDGAIKEAQDTLQGADLSKPADLLKSKGITNDAINGIYNKYGKTMKGKAILAMMGTSPEAVRDQALNLLDGKAPQVNSRGRQSKPANSGGNRIRFPKLK